MNILVIDTSDSKNIRVGIKINGKSKYISSNAKVLKAQAVLPLIDKVLKANNINLSDINKIKVNTGPGSFTGLRVGISIVNALGFFLKIPINGKKVGKLVEPRYK
ncbi:MAG: tRNA (adenosine(37)-N6)-threonylcarbamoyltransferase complex dimerization subunit type 1 TsaB [Patescibacteria group bacterium]